MRIVIPLTKTEVQFFDHKIARIVLISLSIFIYTPIFFNEFQLLWDDQWVVINEYTEYGLDPKNIWRILTEYYHGQYAPINQLFYSIIYTMFGYNAFVFHLSSYLFHLLNTLLVYEFVKKLVPHLINCQPNQDRMISFFTAIIFLCHPVQVETVAWISASKVLLYALFYLLALNLYLHYIESKKNKLLYLTFLCFLLSFGSKEQAVTLPICLLLLDFVVGNRDLSNKKLWLEKMVFLLVCLIFGYITMKSQAAVDDGVLSNKDQYPLYQRIVFASYALFEYTIKCLLPIKLSYIYPFPIQIGQKLPLTFYAYPFAIVAATAFLWKYLKQKLGLFTALFFIIHLSVCLHIIPIARFTITADRYVYIASIAIFLILAVFFIKIFYKIDKRYALVAFTIYCLALSVYTNRRISVWNNSETLKEEIRGIIKSRADFDSLNKKFRKVDNPVKNQ